MWRNTKPEVYLYSKTFPGSVYSCIQMSIAEPPFLIQPKPTTKEAGAFQIVHLYLF